MAASREYDLESPTDVPIYLRRRAEKGQLLNEVLHDALVVSTVRAASGVMLVPTVATYYFYRGNDHISLHTDAGHCPFALLVKVFGDPLPLISFPKLLGCSQAELKQLVEQGVAGLEGRPMGFPSGGAVFFRGCELPHHRPPRPPGSELVGVAQLCYRPVWNKIGSPNKMVSSRPVQPTPAR